MKFKRLAVFIILISSSACADDYNLASFFAPKIGVQNTYSCIFPCERVEVTGEATGNMRELKLKEVYYFSEQIMKNNPNIPSNIVKNKTLTLLDNKIVDGDRHSRSVLLMEPVKIKTNWEIHGVMGSFEESSDYSNAESKKVSWSCEIVEYGKDNILFEERSFIEVNCVSNFSPKQVILTRYATKLGLIERTTKDLSTGNVIDEIKILKTSK